MNKVIFTLTGPSASGKSTLERKMVEAGFARVISTTTRTPRSGEIPGVDYHFTTPESFKELKEKGHFLESVGFNGNYYGASIDEFERCFAEGEPVVIVVEPNGQQQIKENAARRGWIVLSIFIDVSIETQIERLTDRFLADLYVGDLDLKKVHRAFKARLKSAMTKERTWVDDAHDDAQDIYTYVLHRFDEENERDVVKLLCDAANLALNSEVIQGLVEQEFGWQDDPRQGHLGFYQQPEDPHAAVR